MSHQEVAARDLPIGVSQGEGLGPIHPELGDPIERGEFSVMELFVGDELGDDGSDEPVDPDDEDLALIARSAAQEGLSIVDWDEWLEQLDHEAAMYAGEDLEYLDNAEAYLDTSATSEEIDSLRVAFGKLVEESNNWYEGRSL